MMPPSHSWPLYDDEAAFSPTVAAFVAEYPQLNWLFLRRHHASIRAAALLTGGFLLLLAGYGLWLQAIPAGTWGSIHGGAMYALPIVVLSVLFGLLARHLSRGHRLAIGWLEIIGAVLLPIAMAVGCGYAYDQARPWIGGPWISRDYLISFGIGAGLLLWLAGMGARIAGIAADAISHAIRRDAIVVGVDRDSIEWLPGLHERFAADAQLASLFVQPANRWRYLRLMTWLVTIGLWPRIWYENLSYGAAPVSRGANVLLLCLAVTAVGIVAGLLIDLSRPTLRPLYFAGLTFSVGVVISSLTMSFHGVGLPVFSIPLVAACGWSGLSLLRFFRNYSRRLQFLSDVVDP